MPLASFQLLSTSPAVQIIAQIIVAPGKRDGNSFCFLGTSKFMMRLRVNF
jgi:hypothetical protein